MISHICFVCCGNTCRAPIAAPVFRPQRPMPGLLAQVRP
ncbi:arsenate reductase/protein-tyrosine-phosphatase family protein [Amycolatopsis acidiphila]